MQRRERKKKNIYSLCLGLILLILEAVAAVGIILHRSWDRFGSFGVLSNAALMVVIIIWLICLASNIRDGIRLPEWIHILKYIATCLVVLTFVVFLTVIGPVTGDFSTLFRRDGALLHIVCPILAAADFLILEHDAGIRPIHTLLALLPAFLYGAVALILNLSGIWNGPYFFLKVHEQSTWMSIIWAIMILGIGWVLNVILRAANRSITREYVY